MTAELSTSGEKDPYMQAYITARMKNQVEEMKLQKILADMEVSQRVRKIMINLELFEDRKIAHKLQKEVEKATNRQRQAMSRFLRQKNARQRMTSNWASSTAAGSAHAPNCSTGDLSHPHPAPETASHPRTAPTSGKRAVYPVTGTGKDYGEDAGGGGTGDFPAIHRPDIRSESAGRPLLRGGRDTAVNKNTSINNAVPVIQVTDCSGKADNLNTVAADNRQAPKRLTTAPEKIARAWIDQDTTTLKAAPGSTAHHAVTKTATIVTPPPVTHRVQQQQQHYQQQQEQHHHHHHSHVSQSTPGSVTHHNYHHYHSAPGSVYFSPVSRPRSEATTMTARKRLSSASSLWQGDPRAISSVRRERRNIEEMLATVKSGEETRRLIREATPTCSRNCSKPNILTLLERTYVNLPDLLPEIAMVREKMAEQEAEAMGLLPPTAEESCQGSLPPSATAKKRSLGRFDLPPPDDEENGGMTAKLPIYHINYSKLREIDGSRRNSVLA